MSDLHLFVTSDGRPRPPEDRELLVKFFDLMGRINVPYVNKLAGGFNVHYPPALTSMLETLDGLLSAARGENDKLLLLQTGDMSTFGRLPEKKSIQFPEWAYWMNHVMAPLRPKADEWIDLYGNHDVWPGTLPAWAFWRARRAARDLRRQYFPKRSPRRIEVPFGTHRLDVYILDTICASADANTAALGDLDTDRDAEGVGGDDPYPLSESFDPLDELVRLEADAGQLPEGRVIRAIAMHHPPHYFTQKNEDDKVVGSPLTEGLLAGAGLLGDLLNECPFELVIAGHRHAVDPPGSLRTVQTPLPRETLQLVCGSPTQRPGPDSERPSFSVYDLEVGDDRRATLTRHIYRFTEGPPIGFVRRDTAMWALPDP